MVFSDVFGKSSSVIINTILSQNEFNSEIFKKMFIERCKAFSEDILNSIDDISWVDAQKERNSKAVNFAPIT